MSKKISPKNINFLEKAVATWLQYDPFVTIVVRNDNDVRRDVMLNLLGPEAAKKLYGKLPQRRTGAWLICPQSVREAVEVDLTKPVERSALIKKLIFWATDPTINGLYIDSQLTRIQIVNSLLGPVFFHANATQEDLIFKGLKFMLVKKQTAIGKPGEQSYEVHDVLLGKVIEILIYNQKVIINKAVKEAEEKMRVHLLRQIQELRGEKTASGAYGGGLKINVGKIVKEKFPLRRETVNHLEDILEFYCQSSWDIFRLEAEEAKKKIIEIRKPLTLTAEEIKS